MNQTERMLAAFRGIPASALKKEPRVRAKSIEGLLDSIVRHYKIETPRVEQLIMQNWRAIVGAQNAHRCKPSKLSGETLIITTLNPTLRMELQFNQQTILERLQHYCGKNTIQQLRIR
jgi:hypothetical protein